MTDEEVEESGYEVTLPSFHGPLDLLLHLIKQNEIDIYDIPIVPITEQYTAYLDAMEELDLEVAADYIYMAALLIHIKSQMLLPRDENAEGQIEDPRAELVNRLLEYQRFKQVAETFAELDVVRMGVWPRPAVKLPESEAARVGGPADRPVRAPETVRSSVGSIRSPDGTAPAVHGPRRGSRCAACSSAGVCPSSSAAVALQTVRQRGGCPPTAPAVAGGEVDRRPSPEDCWPVVPGQTQKGPAGPEVGSWRGLSAVLRVPLPGAA